MTGSLLRRRALAGYLAILAPVWSIPSACTTTVDSLGYDTIDAGLIGDGDADVDADADADVAADADADTDAGGEGGAGGQGPEMPTLTPLVGLPSYPNAFGDLLGKSDQQITGKIQGAFDQLFYGDPNGEAIYFPVGNDQAEIRDIYHGDIRTEGLGLAMLICVELDKKPEFDKLWRYSKEVKASTGANAGYFDSSCDTANGAVLCVDPYGYQQFTMALIFAHDLWGSEGDIDYQTDALALLDVMRHKEEQNGGIVDDVTNTFDAETKLVFDVPSRTASSFTRPSLEMPAYYELWAQATGDAFWREAAESARSYLGLVAHPMTGLTPMRAFFDGTPKEGGSYFGPEAYRGHLNVALDVIWTRTPSWPVVASDRLIGFFYNEGVQTYGASYEIDGTPIDRLRDTALIVANGLIAASSTRDERREFVQAVWDTPTPSGPVRYYSGLLDLLALMTLGGRLKII